MPLNVWLPFLWVRIVRQWQMIRQIQYRILILFRLPVLASTGRLDGKKATTHHLWADETFLAQCTRPSSISES